MPFQPILADLWQNLAPLFVAAFFAVRAYLEARAAKNKKKQLALPRDLEPVAVDKQGRGAKEDSDVDDFLRRLSDEQQAERKQQKAAEHAAKQREEAPPKRVVQRPVRQSPPRQPLRQTAQGEGPRRGESVDEHVRSHLRHLEESQLAENAAMMGGAISQTDERTEARLRSKFDHRLGTLRRDEPVPAELPPQAASAATADSIAAMLANPEGVRNAIILNEILARPTDRW